MLSMNRPPGAIRSMHSASTAILLCLAPVLAGLLACVQACAATNASPFSVTATVAPLCQFALRSGGNVPALGLQAVRRDLADVHCSMPVPYQVVVSARPSNSALERAGFSDSVGAPADGFDPLYNQRSLQNHARSFDFADVSPRPATFGLSQLQAEASECSALFSFPDTISVSIIF